MDTRKNNERTRFETMIGYYPEEHAPPKEPPVDEKADEKAKSDK